MKRQPDVTGSILPHTATEAVKLTTAHQYVKKLATKAVYDNLTSRGGSAIIAGLDTSTGRALAVQVNDATFATKLDLDLTRLRAQLGITGEAADWDPDSDQFKVSGTVWALCGRCLGRCVGRCAGRCVGRCACVGRRVGGSGTVPTIIFPPSAVTLRAGGGSWPAHHHAAAD